MVALGDRDDDATRSPASYFSCGRSRSIPIVRTDFLLVGGVWGVFPAFPSEAFCNPRLSISDSLGERIRQLPELRVAS
jgi:hypothetical protein